MDIFKIDARGWRWYRLVRQWKRGEKLDKFEVVELLRAGGHVPPEAGDMIAHHFPAPKGEPRSQFKRGTKKLPVHAERPSQVLHDYEFFCEVLEGREQVPDAFPEMQHEIESARIAVSQGQRAVSEEAYRLTAFLHEAGEQTVKDICKGARRARRKAEG